MSVRVKAIKHVVWCKRNQLFLFFRLWILQQCYISMLFIGLHVCSSKSNQACSLMQKKSTLSILSALNIAAVLYFNVIYRNTLMTMMERNFVQVRNAVFAFEFFAQFNCSFLTEWGSYTLEISGFVSFSCWLYVKAYYITTALAFSEEIFVVSGREVKFTASVLQGGRQHVFFCHSLTLLLACSRRMPQG